jgi:hypothetical protein
MTLAGMRIRLELLQRSRAGEQPARQAFTIRVGRVIGTHDHTGDFKEW